MIIFRKPERVKDLKNAMHRFDFLQQMLKKIIFR